MKPGEIQKIIISVTPTNASPMLEYESDNPDVVTAAIGTLIANSEGTANITVRVSGTEIQDTVKVTVANKTQGNEGADDEKPDDKEEEKPDEETIRINKITVENKTIYLERYETERIVYSISPVNVTNENVTFKSSNTSVATVDENGFVYAKRSGSATITIESNDGGAKATVKVYVSDDNDNDYYDSNLRNIYITYDDEIVNSKLEVMETTAVKLGIKVSPDSASKKVTWRSSNKKVATVDSNGKVKGVKNGTCTIYATSTVNSSKWDSVTVVVTNYVKYPDKISVSPQENAVYETGNRIQFTASLYPEETTETDIIWQVGSGATITQNGLLTITDSGEITVKAYASNYKTVGEYKFNAVYSKEHFASVGSAYNLLNNRCIEMYFDADTSTYSAVNNIFATSDLSGNGEKIQISVRTDGKKIIVSPLDKWPEGDVYIFINESLCDIQGNTLGKNLKYKLNIRGN